MEVPTASPRPARRPTPVSTADWIEAAHQVFADRGLGAIRVEVLARELGVTKGSFYWHFADRGALVAAVVERWENAHTEAMIVESERGADPADKVRRLLVAVSAGLGETSGEPLLYVEARREGIQAALDRVTERRLDYLSGLLVDLGQDRGEAERRAALALAAAIGMQQLLTGAPDAMHRPALQRGRYTDFLYGLLVSGPDPVR